MIAPPVVSVVPIPISNARPVVMPVEEIESVFPANDAVLLVISARVPAVDAVEERSSNVPVVVEVSTDDEESLSSDPPFAITEVV